MDYAIFILHRFVENRQAGEKVQDAMVDAVKQSVGSVLSSGLTTVSGFAALILMRFRIGPDMGWVMAKAIVLSLFSVLCFLPALTMISYKLIDKTQHRSFVPKFEKFSTAVLKVRVPVLTVFVLILIPCIWVQNNNSFYYGSSQVYSSEATQMGRDMNAILFTDRYLGKRKQSSRKQAAWETVKDCTISIFTSASILTIAGTILGIVSTNLVLSQLGTLVGRGATISFILVIFVLPTLLMLFDKCIEKTTWHASFYKEEKKKISLKV
ncbi:MMPL family transporter [Mediterraneibacter butyricigenes]|nr:MMPL family transporter [Mediterraneibacter butyricigenes]